MAQSILAWLDPRQTTSDPDGWIHTKGVLAPDLIQDVAGAPVHIERIVAGREPANDHDCFIEAARLDEHGFPPCLPRFRARAPGVDAVAKVIAG
jgi:hypothetical protein